MNDNQFSALLAVIIPQVIHIIITENKISETEAISQFYKSSLYKELSDESTKLWHYGPMMLYSMYHDELIKGYYEYPEES